MTPVAPNLACQTIRTHPKIAELSELVRLIEAPTRLEHDNRGGLRNRAMLELLFATGMRISELVNLMRDQIDNTGRIFILEKEKRTVCLYDRTLQISECVLTISG